MKKESKYITNFNKGKAYTIIRDENIAEWADILTANEITVLYHLAVYMDNYNVIKQNQKILSMQDMSELLVNYTYDAIRKVVPSLIKKNALCSYYIEVCNNIYIKSYILNPRFAIKENFQPKYAELFNNHNLIEENRVLYENHSERDTPEYRQWVQNSLERDNYTCQCCGSSENLEVHHILNYSDHKELRTDLDNSITLCQCCHSPMIGGSFHNIYGTRNNTQEQLDDYIKLHTQK